MTAATVPVSVCPLRPQASEDSSLPPTRSELFLAHSPQIELSRGYVGLQKQEKETLSWLIFCPQRIKPLFRKGKTEIPTITMSRTWGNLTFTTQSRRASKINTSCTTITKFGSLHMTISPLQNKYNTASSRWIF